MIVAGLLACLSLSATDMGLPADAVQTFLEMYLSEGQAGGHLEQALSLRPFLSARLGRVLEDAAACQDDWCRQQTDPTFKPPFVDCCIFSQAPDGVPHSFRVGSTQRLKDGRYQVLVTFTRVESSGTYSWQDAMILVGSPGRYRIDDVLFLPDPPSKPWLLSGQFHGCDGPRWVGSH